MLMMHCIVLFCIGTWSATALCQVGHEFTLTLDTGYTQYSLPEQASPTKRQRSASSASTVGGDEYLSPLPLLFMVSEQAGDAAPNLQNAVVAALVSIHGIVKEVTLKQARSSGRQHYLSPRYPLLSS